MRITKCSLIQHRAPKVSRPRVEQVVRVVAAALVAGSVALVWPAGARAQAPPARPEVPLVRLSFPHDDGSLTPYTFELGYPLLTLVYDTLLWRDKEGVPQPWLAESFETSPDAMALTLQLAQGARWHDGQAVTADDVAFTFRYFAEHPHPRFTPELNAVQKVETVGPSTVVITLRQPSPGFLDQPLADLPILPAHLWSSLSRGQVAPDGLPIGSGPYRLVEHRQGQSYRFVADPEYFRGRPAVDAIEVPFIDQAEAAIDALQQRQLDMIGTSLASEDATRVRAGGTRLARGPSYVGTSLMFNVRVAPFDRPEVRQALAQTLDLGRIARTVGDSIPADRGYLHPDSPWAPGDALHSFAASRTRLTDLGLGPFDILAPENDPKRLEAGRVVVASLQEAGVPATLRPVSRDQLSRAVGETGSPPSFGVAIWGTPALASYDPDFLSRVFGSDPRQAPLNFSGYRNPAFDALGDRIAVTVDPVERRAAVTEALGLLASDLPTVPLVFPTGTFAYRPSVYAGWVFVKGSGILDKRSFTEPVESQPTVGPDVTNEQTASGWSPIQLAAVVLLVAASGIAVVLVRGRR